MGVECIRCMAASSSMAAARCSCGWPRRRADVLADPVHHGLHDEPVSVVALERCGKACKRVTELHGGGFDARRVGFEFGELPAQEGWPIAETVAPISMVQPEENRTSRAPRLK